MRQEVVLAIVFATKAEGKPFLKSLETEIWIEEPFPIYGFSLPNSEHKAVCMISGMGKVAAEVAMCYLLIHYKPRYVINAGLAGTLLDDLLLGDVVQIDTVLDVDLRESFEDDHKALAVNEGPWADLMPLSLVTVDRPIENEDDKKKLALLAHVVDMEAFGIVQVCTDFQLTCMVIKAVGDCADAQAKEDFFKSLPQLAQKLSDTLVAHLSRF